MRGESLAVDDATVFGGVSLLGGGWEIFYFFSKKKQIELKTEAFEKFSLAMLTLTMIEHGLPRTSRPSTQILAMCVPAFLGR